jgi:hypothetical protein
MPIEFQCTACQTAIRTPDGSEGKPARCPRCGAVVTVPTTESVVRAEPVANKPTDAAPQSTNPYASPTNIFAADPFQPVSAAVTAERVRSRLLVPSIGMIVFALTGLLFMAMVAVGMMADPNQVFQNVGDDPAKRAGAIGFFVAYFSVGLITRLVQLVGAIAMLRVRGYSLALAGALATVIPCEVYCCLPCLPFGIWALVVLNSAEVKAAFR